MRDRYEVSHHFRCKEEEIKTEYLNQLVKMIEQALRDDGQDPFGTRTDIAAAKCEFKGE